MALPNLTEHLSDRSEIERLIESLVAAIEAPGIDDVLECFDQHAVLMDHASHQTYEGRGAVRSYLRIMAPRLRLTGDLGHELVSLDAHHADWALARVLLRGGGGESPLAMLTLSISYVGKAWRIAHLVWAPIDDRRAA